MLVAAVFTTTVYASVNTNTVVVAQDSKTPVKQEELPDAVKAALAGDEYKDKTFSEAFLVKTAAGEHYEIKLKSGADETTVKLDKEGKKVD